MDKFSIQTPECINCLHKVFCAITGRPGIQSWMSSPCQYQLINATDRLDLGKLGINSQLGRRCAHSFPLINTKFRLPPPSDLIFSMAIPSGYRNYYRMIDNLHQTCKSQWHSFVARLCSRHSTHIQCHSQSRHCHFDLSCYLPLGLGNT